MKRCMIGGKIIDYIEGLLSDKDRLDFENHLKFCNYCQKEIEEYKKLYDIFKYDEVPAPEQEFFEKLKIKGHQREIVYKRYPVWKTLGILSPAAMAALIIFVLLKPSRQTIEISIPVSNLLESKDISYLLLDRVVDEKLSKQFTALEEYFQPDVEESINELAREEKEEFIKKVHSKYGLNI